MNKELIELFTQVFVVASGVFLGIAVAFRMFWSKVELTLYKARSFQGRSQNKALQQLEFAAYERLLLLVHRMDPQQAIGRNHEDEVAPVSFVAKLIADLENEYQHNLAQQLYVSEVAWKMVTDLKNDTLLLFKNTLKTLPENGTSAQYVAIVLNHVKGIEVSPYQSVQMLLKREMKG
ncbi:hypothetical protein [Sphingobacterium sp. LRF_L2]|uniref:DUF7935 family protein n=1 Tax=Sphingobacterium sp. LRF_L2 TaxID=3369421 RepID=UPI003F61B401